MNIINRLRKDPERLRMIICSAFALCIVAISLCFFILSIGKPFMGIRLALNGQGWVVVTIDNNGVANRSGIEEGDRPIAINGLPAEVFLKQYEKAGMVFGRLISELTVVDDHGQLKSVTLQGASAPWQTITNQVAELITCFVFWIIAFYVFFKRPKNIAALLLLLTSLSVGLALSGNLAAGFIVPTAFWFEVIATGISPWLLLHFFLVLPEERTWPRNNPLIYLIYLPVAITLVLIPLIGYVDGQPVQWFRSVRLFGYGGGFLAAASVAFSNYFSTSLARTRQQMKIILISYLAALIPFLLLNILPAAIWGRTILPPEFSILLIVFIPLGMGYAIITRRLMDIDVLVRRGVVYGLVTTIMAAILSAAIFFVMALRRTLEVPEEILIALALGAVATALFGPVNKGAELLVDKFLYKDRYDYRQIIHSLSNSLRSAQDSTDISRLVVGTTVNALQLAGGCLFLKTASGSFDVGAIQGTLTEKGKQQQLFTLISERNHLIEFPNSAQGAFPDLAFIIPLTAGEMDVGVLCLSQKSSRQDFSSNDVFLLQGIASVAAIALHSAMLVRDVSLRDTFVSVASHELRTPLTSIVGYADLLLHRNPSDEIKQRWITNILNSGQKVSAMVDDLLNVSRIQSGKVNIKLERVQLHNVLEEAICLTRESSHNHEFIVDIEVDLPDVFVDREKVGQVVGNLLNNAVKYSPNGGRIILSAHLDKERNRITISVADEGIGIAPADRTSLFTTFHRIQRPETHGIRGNGLGLYIAKGWTEAMGGEIWLESELNKGSVFFVAFPVADANSERKENAGGEEYT